MVIRQGCASRPSPIITQTQFSIHDMAHERHKGEAGMGGRGKDVARNRQSKATAKRKRNPGPSATLTKPSPKPRTNQRRNQREWSTEKTMRRRY